ncbi:hypothetical protein C2R22_06345 [Salinigranum rubrum]|uniref:Uncharacterized protein n=1 Tax=Salinigranum rubrum TaxID=755307 RepID=A0A2I8VHC7_9EURY|nr:hypothetical protein [Salinigranum rubrum]AUV81331.1 hypothetical protein C2R22_06345 [Salinigranum rubrum]
MFLLERLEPVDERVQARDEFLDVSDEGLGERSALSLDVAVSERLFPGNGAVLADVEEASARLRVLAGQRRFSTDRRAVRPDRTSPPGTTASASRSPHQRWWSIRRAYGRYRAGSTQAWSTASDANSSSVARASR